ncbi:MAG: DNA-binding NtrC family response regulator [Halioglobus sp.]|jgi:DNA-binding NtrC family response regulator
MRVSNECRQRMVIIDRILRGYSELDALRATRTLLAETPVIMVSAH